MAVGRAEGVLEVGGDCVASQLLLLLLPLQWEGGGFSEGKKHAQEESRTIGTLVHHTRVHQPKKNISGLEGFETLRVLT